MRLFNFLLVVAQLARLAYAHQESSVAASTQGSWNALSVLLAALETFPHTTSTTSRTSTTSSTPTTSSASTKRTGRVVTITPPTPPVVSITTLSTTTLPTTTTEDRPTVTVILTVTPNNEYTERKQQNGTAFSNAMSETEATTPTTTAATQPSPVESYDFRYFPTDMSTVTLTRGGPAPALTVTDLAKNGSFSNTTAAPTVWITTTAFPDEISSRLQAYGGNTLTWSKTFSNDTSGSGGCAASGNGVMFPTRGPGTTGYGASMTISHTDPLTDEIGSATGLGNTGDAAGMTTSTSTATAASATSTVTLTDTALVIPVQANNTQPINVPEPSTSPYEDNTPTTETMTSPVTSSSDDAVGVQTTMPIESIQPATTAVTAYDGIHIPHGHPPLITGGQDHKNWNTSTTCTDYNTQQVPDIAPTPSPFVTTTTSRVFIGYPPSLSGYNNGTNANTSTSMHESSTTTELVTPTAAIHVEIPPPPTVPLDSCTPGIWGRPGCLSTPTSFFDVASTPVGHQVQNPTVLAATLAEIPPPPTVPLNSCRPEIWGRPGCLSTPASFSDNVPTPVGHKVADATAVSASSITPATNETPALSTYTSSTTQPAQAQCTSTFYSLPINACTSTIYASKETVTVNCFGCVGAHALPSNFSNGSSSCQSSKTITKPCTTRTMCGFPDPTTASGSFVTSVTSALST